MRKAPNLKRLCLNCIALFLANCAASVSNTDRTITIKRDTFGVPHIYSKDVRGLFYGYGYVVAEDRLYQMEMARRSVLGRVSEVMGPAYLALDKGSRASFSPDSIRMQMAHLSADDAAIFDGYAAGFNARVKEVLAEKARLMPKQFIDGAFCP